MVDKLRQVLEAKTVLMQTRKRDGSWVGTPLSLVTDSGHTYFRTDHAALRTRR